MRTFVIAAGLALVVGAVAFARRRCDEWPRGGAIPAASASRRSSTIDRGNVHTLKVAWTFRTGDAYQPKDSRPTAFEATPLYVDGTLYLSTPLGRILALDPVTGQQRWAYDAKIDKDAGYGDFASRGVSTWKSPAGQRRIFLATIDARLIAVDAATGKPCADFGENGVVDLRRGLRIAPTPTASPTTRRPRRRRSSATRSSSAPASPTTAPSAAPERRGARLRRRHRQAEVDLGPDSAGPERPRAPGPGRTAARSAPAPPTPGR